MSMANDADKYSEVPHEIRKETSQAFEVELH
jgi:hypothetical protein